MVGNGRTTWFEAMWSLVMTRSTGFPTGGVTGCIIGERAARWVVPIPSRWPHRISHAIAKQVARPTVTFIGRPIFTKSEKR